MPVTCMDNGVITSGGGIESIQDQTVDFGATEGPMTDEQMEAAKGGPIFHVPTALGAVIATYNVPGLSETLRFTPDTLSGIYLGDIKKWNNPKLVADNAELAKVDQAIAGGASFGRVRNTSGWTTSAR